MIASASADAGREEEPRREATWGLDRGQPVGERCERLQRQRDAGLPNGYAARHRDQIEAALHAAVVALDLAAWEDPRATECVRRVASHHQGRDAIEGVASDHDDPSHHVRAQCVRTLVSQIQYTLM